MFEFLLSKKERRAIAAASRQAYYGPHIGSGSKMLCCSYLNDKFTNNKLSFDDFRSLEYDLKHVKDFRAKISTEPNYKKFIKIKDSLPDDFESLSERKQREAYNKVAPKILKETVIKKVTKKLSNQINEAMEESFGVIAETPKPTKINHKKIEEEISSNKKLHIPDDKFEEFESFSSVEDFVNCIKQYHQDHPESKINLENAFDDEEDIDNEEDIVEEAIDVEDEEYEEPEEAYEELEMEDVSDTDDVSDTEDTSNAEDAQNTVETQESDVKSDANTKNDTDIDKIVSLIISAKEFTKEEAIEYAKTQFVESKISESEEKTDSGDKRDVVLIEFGDNMGIAAMFNKEGHLVQGIYGGPVSDDMFKNIKTRIPNDVGTKVKRRVDKEGTMTSYMHKGIIINLCKSPETSEDKDFGCINIMYAPSNKEIGIFRTKRSKELAKK